MRITIVTCLVVGFVTAAYAEGPTTPPGQEKGFSLDRMRIDKGKQVVYNIETGMLESVTGGFDITLLPKNPEEKGVRLRGDTLEFVAPQKEGERPTQLILKSNVIIDHPQVVIMADKAEWDQESNVLVFTGNPMIKSSQAKEIRGTRMELDLNTMKFHVQDFAAPEVNLRQEPKAANPEKPAVFDTSSVRDWSAFLARLRKENEAARATPGKTLTAMLDADSRAAIVKLSSKDAPSEALTKKVSGAIDAALRSKAFYSAAAWEGVTIPEDAQELLDKGIESLSARDTIRLNRALLESAFPNDIAATHGG